MLDGEILVLSSIFSNLGLGGATVNSRQQALAHQTTQKYKEQLSCQNGAGKSEHFWMVGSGLRPHPHTQSLGHPGPPSQGKSPAAVDLWICRSVVLFL